jgi:hypothetical protein
MAPSLRSLLFLSAMVLLAVGPSGAFAHVRLLQTGFPIRNAASATGDGVYSVSGPCGGVSAYGKNGVALIQAGSSVSMKIAYNGGHQDVKNAFHAAVYCTGNGIARGSTFDDSVLKIGATSGGAQPLASGGDSVPAADSSTAGYTLQFTAPPLAAGAAPQDCVFALLDQRNWGGCVDVQLLAPPPSDGGGGGDIPTPPADNSKPTSDCTKYCTDIGIQCRNTNGGAQLAQFASTAACMGACANYTRTSFSSGVAASGDNFECRRASLNKLLKGEADAATSCPLAGPTPSSTCRDTTQAQRDAHTASPCARYCAASASKCASNFASTALCMQTCATFLDRSTGSTLVPAQGDNVACRLQAAESSSCAAAASATGSGSGICAPANPLTLAKLNDTLSATYVTTVGMCDTALAAASNTIAGCCCVNGTVELIHVQGSRLATINTALTVQGGAMCSAGFVSVPQYDFSANPPQLNGKTNNYTFTSGAVVVTQSTNVILSQKDDKSSVEMAGTLTIGGDAFTIDVVENDDDGSLSLQLTNAVKSPAHPRVCSVSAAYATRIDSSGMVPPPDDNGDINAAVGTQQPTAFVVMMLAALTAVVAGRR